MSLKFSRWPGFVWLVIAPLFVLAATLSTVEPIYVYHIQLITVSSVATAGFIIAILFIQGYLVARKLLFGLNWFIAMCFVGAAILGFFLSLYSEQAELSIDYVMGSFFIASTIALPSIPFIIIARKIKLMRSSNA